MSKGKVSLIIASYNQKARLGNCLLSIEHQMGVEYEAIVVDDGSTDGSPGLLRQWGGTLIESSHAGNVARLYNLGVMASKGSVIVLLHADFILPPDFCLRAAHAHISKPGRTVISGVWRPLNHTPSTTETDRVLRWLGAKPRQAPSWSETRTVSRSCVPEPEWMSAAHPLASIKREHWVERDESFPFVYTDWEWAYRLSLAGFDFYWCPLMQGFHQPHRRLRPGDDPRTAKEETAFKAKFGVAPLELWKG